MRERRGARRAACAVFDGLDDHDRDVTLVHEDTAPLRRMAVFDVITNNADRKGGHVLEMTDGHRYGVDHGLTFHHEPKLRTVLWGWHGDAARRRARRRRRAGAGGAGRRRSATRWPTTSPTSRSTRFARRCRRLLDRGVMPAPRGRVARRSRGRPSDRPRARCALELGAMRSWSAPEVPTLPVTGPPVALHDTASGGRVTVAPADGGPARLYVCGITPYDATHLGHAATYVAFDLLNRAWRNAGHDVIYVQNVTDVDDPLLERADQGQRRLGRARRARDRAVPPGHAGAAGAAARPLHRRRRVDPAGRRR